MNFDDNKLIAIFTIIFGALILAYCTYRQNAALLEMYIAFMTIGCGLKVTKGIVDLKRDQIKSDQKLDQKNENGS